MTTPQHSAEIDRKARELLAAEYRTIGDITCANAISTDPDICGREKLAIRAIEAALSLTPPAATDGRELPEPDYVETIPASHFKDEPTARHWYSAETLRRMMQATTSAAAVPEGWVFEILTNIKRSAIRGRNAAGTPDNALASSFVATCDHIENLADQALSAAPQPQADHFADVGKMMPQAEATRQPVTCKSDLQVQPEAKAGADDAIGPCDPAAEHHGFDRTASLSSDTYVCECGGNGEYPKPAEGGAVGDAKSTVDDIMFGWRLGQQRVTKGDAENLAARYARKKCHTFATAGSGEAVALLREAYEWLFESKSDGPRVSEGAIVKGFYSEEFRGFHDRLLTAIASIETPSPYAVPVESLGRDARGVDAVRLAKIGYEAAAQVTGCDQSWEHANKPKWIACAEAIARRLTASDARPVIDEAMVERALTEWFYDLSWADVQKEYEDGGDKLRNYMRAALTAALSPENKS